MSEQVAESSEPLATQALLRVGIRRVNLENTLAGIEMHGMG
jgi:hypothetical protein